MKRVAILQSNYLPWKGYFDIIGSVDTFIFFDDVQFTKNDWRNRNIIKTPNGCSWLSIPCGSNINRLISQVVVDNMPWQENHWKEIERSYCSSPYWSKYRNIFEEIFLHTKWHLLSELNQHLIKTISEKIFGFDTDFDQSSRFKTTTKKTERLIEILCASGATHYLSGPSARNYIEEERFDKAGIMLEYIDYSGYPEYQQLHGGPFVHHVSVIDLVFNTGPEAASYLVKKL